MAPMPYLLRTALVTVLLVTVACGADGGQDGNAPLRAAPPEQPATDIEPDDAGEPEAPDEQDGIAAPDESPGSTDDDAPIGISLRLDRRVDDPATDDFDDVVRSTLTDERGWEQAGFRFAFDDADPPYTVVLAEGHEVDELCAPYDTGGRFSCQIGPVVALNADRWRQATPQWTGDLAPYRQMLVNHEVGHLLGQNHPEVGCPGPGEPAPVMTQQSTNLGDCLPNPWPLDWEVACASMRGLRPLAPPFERVDGPLCGPDGPVG
jgi:hypothetical protein